MVWNIPHSPSPLANKKILLIESGRAIRDVQAAFLQNYGIQVHVADDIEEARSRCLQHRHDLVALEILGDGAAAEEFCAELKQQNPQQKVALLVSPLSPTVHIAADEVISKAEGPTICTHPLKWMLTG